MADTTKTKTEPTTPPTGGTGVVSTSAKTTTAGRSRLRDEVWVTFNAETKATKAIFVDKYEALDSVTDTLLDPNAARHGVVSVKFGEEVGEAIDAALKRAAK